MRTCDKVLVYTANACTLLRPLWDTKHPGSRYNKSRVRGIKITKRLYYKHARIWDRTLHQKTRHKSQTVKICTMPFMKVETFCPMGLAKNNILSNENKIQSVWDNAVFLWVFLFFYCAFKSWPVCSLFFSDMVT